MQMYKPSQSADSQEVAIYNCPDIEVFGDYKAWLSTYNNYSKKLQKAHNLLDCS